MILDTIEKANDIKKVPRNQYDELASEIREFIIENVSNTGGHLSSSLGVVELTMALHLSLNLPKDKILWDVGHQSYVHKILTGRKDEFSSLRQHDGISGFPSREESDCDAFTMGHASTSISAALGFAKARELAGTDETIVAVIGDGSLTGGMAYEAMNNCSQLNSNMIIILNDNEMAISKNVGGISNVLTEFRTGDHYMDLKQNVKNRLSRIPGYGDAMIDKIHNTKNSIKQLMVPGNVFEHMGITYLGPVDGHDIQQLIRVIHAAKRVKRPVLIHIHTTKGKGYPYAERRPSFYHGVAPFDADTGELKNTKKVRTYPAVFGSTLNKMAGMDERIVAITAAMPEGTGLMRYERTYPERFFDVGIAEEHAVTFAAGMAAEGYKPYVAIYSTFMQRAFDQIVHDVCIPNLPVRFVVENAGLVGNDGMTHQGVFDLSYFGMVPNMTIMAPKNRHEFYEMLMYSRTYDGPLMIRVPKGAVSMCCDNQASPIVYSKCEVVKESSQRDVVILAVGSMVELSLEVAEQLAMFGIDPTVVNMRFVKPFDEEYVKRCAEEFRLIVTIEENVLSGGFGSHVLSYVNDLYEKAAVMNLGLQNEFVPHASIAEQRMEAGLDLHTVTAKILQRLERLS